MRRSIMPALVALVVLLIGFGFYRGWFAVTSPEPEAGSHKVNVNLTVDPDKVKADAGKVTGKSTEPGGKPGEGANQLGDGATDSY